MNDKEYLEWEETVSRIQKKNLILIEEFERWLEGKKLSTKTIKSHKLNIDFFINGYLLRYDPIEAEHGACEIGYFLGDFFIRKALWSSASSVKENVVSFKKFYTFMVETGRTPAKDLSEMLDIIKAEKESWIEVAKNY